MFGSSSTTTTVPFSALTGSSLAPPAPRIAGMAPSLTEPSRLANTGITRSPQDGASKVRRPRVGTGREEGRMSAAQKRPQGIRPGTAALATAALATAALATAALATAALATAALATAATLGVAAAGAATPSSGNSGSTAAPATLAGIKAKAATDITARVNALNSAIAKVNTAQGLGSGQATLVSYLGTDLAPLQQLNQTIQGDT